MAAPLALFTAALLETNFVWNADVALELDRARRIRDELGEIVPRLEETGGGQYSRMQYEVVRHAIDAIDGWELPRGRSGRAAREVGELMSFAPQALERARRILQGNEADMPAPRHAFAPLKAEGPILVSRREWPDGTVEEDRPVSLVGWGHWGATTRDLPMLRRMGFGFQQVEVRMKDFMPAPRVTNAGAMSFCRNAAAAAAANDTMVDLVLGLHYAPEWLVGARETNVCDNGFMHFCVHDADAAGALAGYAAMVASEAARLPAISSLCLSNEPSSADVSRCDRFRRLWEKHLAEKFGSVEAMNAAWGTDFAAFSDVGRPVFPELPQTPAALEYVRCERKALADFHERVARAVRAAAPDLPVHAKLVLDGSFLRRTHNMFWSIDGERYAKMFDWHDLDPVAFLYYGGESEDGENLWANGWMRSEAACDLLRGFAAKPLVNSENHDIVDDSIRRVPPEHVYSALWQEALHGLCATALWTWERGRSDRDVFNGLAPEHPDCLEALGRCALDLQRLADEIAPIQALRPTVAVLSSLSSQVLGEMKFLDGYCGVSFIGEPIGVVTDEALARHARGGAPEPPLDTVRLVLLPSTRHLPCDAWAGLLRLESEGVRIVAAGDTPEFDDCGRPLDGPRFKSAARCDAASIHAALAGLLPDLGLPDRPRLVRPVFGVETHGCENGGCRYLALCNHLRTDVEVELERPGTDLISMTPVGKTLTLRPMMPVFVKFD